MTVWFKRSGKNLRSDHKRDMPEGVWIKCKSCDDTLFNKELARQLKVCRNCGYHFRYSSSEYFNLLLDEGSFMENDASLRSKDFLKFKDSMKYSDRIIKYEKKSGLKDAISCVTGTIDQRQIEIAAMDFAFMGGSVGSVVGEKISRAINRAVKFQRPLIIISCSGGMRMQEGIISLMQMAKVSAALVKLSRAKQPFLSILTNPTTGGTTASFSMLGDICISEPGALIGFAGPRVIKQTIGQDLPEGFQSAEFVLDHGFVDLIVERKDLKSRISQILMLLKPKPGQKSVKTKKSPSKDRKKPNEKTKPVSS